MNPIWGHMYTRPGSLRKDFCVLRKKSVNKDGHLTKNWERTGTLCKGILAEASINDRERTKHLWDQDQHSLTHTLVIRGRTDLRKGDRLDSPDEKTYLVLTCNDVGSLGGAGIIYLEERSDLK